MNYRELGRTGLSVSELCFGTLNFGWATSREEAHALLTTFHDAGGNFIQTSGLELKPTPATHWTHCSESFVGEWMKQRGLRRSEIFIASTLSLLPSGVKGESTSTQVAAAVESALERLGSEYIDLLMCRWTSTLFGADELLLALTRLVQQGKIRYFGFTGMPLWQAAENIHDSSRLSLCRLEAYQASFSLLERGATEAEVQQFCRHHRVALLAQSPLAGGYLARFDPQLAAMDERTRRLRMRYDSKQGPAIVSAVHEVARERGVAPSTVALAWVLAHPNVTAAVVGARNDGHLRDALAASDFVLHEDERKRLESAGHAVPAWPRRAPSSAIRRSRGGSLVATL